jgi:hypothetical protein
MRQSADNLVGLHPFQRPVLIALLGVRVPNVIVSDEPNVHEADESAIFEYT